MQWLLFLLLALPFYSTSQNKAIDPVFPMRNGKIHYETSFALQIPKDTLFERAENWIRQRKEISKVVSKITIIDSFDVRRLLKGMVGFSLPTKASASKTIVSKPDKVTYLYNLRVYLKNDAIVTLIFDELVVTGNLVGIGLVKSVDEKDTVYVANHLIASTSQNSSKFASSQNTKTAKEESYKQADAQIKASISELIALLHKRPEGLITE